MTINEESIIDIIQFFRKYETASGATINKNETKLIPLANARIHNLQNKIQNIKITKDREIFKILGIFFSNNLNSANEYNWQECL